MKIQPNGHSTLFILFQLFAVTVCIVTSLINITVFPESNQSAFWLGLLSSCLALFIPFPLGYNYAGIFSNPSIERQRSSRELQLIVSNPATRSDEAKDQQMAMRTV